MKALEKAGLVQRHGRTLTITDEGTVQLQRDLSIAAPRIAREFRRLSRRSTQLTAQLEAMQSAKIPDLMPNLDVMVRPFQMPKLTAQLEAMQSAKIPDLLPNLDVMARPIQMPKLTAQLEAMQSAKIPDLMPNLDVMARPFQMPKLTAQLEATRAGLFAGVRVQSEILQRWRDPLAGRVAENLALTTRIAANVTAVANSLAVPRSVWTQQEKVIGRAVSQVVGAHGALADEALSQMVSGHAVPPIGEVLIEATGTTTSLTATTRGMLATNDAPHRSVELLGPSVLDLVSRLKDVGAPASARDLHAAWDVIRRRNPGWEKAASHLTREFIREVLDELAPHERVPKDPNGYVTKRAQISWIVGDSETIGSWVNVTTGNIGKLHSTLSAEAKNAGQPRLDEEGLVGLLETAMGLVRSVVAQVRRLRQG